MSFFSSFFGPADGAQLQFSTNTPGVPYTFTVESRRNVYSCIRVAFGFDSGGQPTIDSLTSDAECNTVTAAPPSAAPVSMTFTSNSILIPFSLLGFINMPALQACLDSKFPGQWSVATTGDQSAALLGGMASVGKGGYRRGRKSRRRKNRKSRRRKSRQ
jgi:hypothetical protein